MPTNNPTRKLPGLSVGTLTAFWGTFFAVEKSASLSGDPDNSLTIEEQNFESKSIIISRETHHPQIFNKQNLT